MEGVIEGTHPTRMELLLVKKKIDLAGKGHKLLKEKRDALAMEFMKYVSSAEEKASESFKQTRRAKTALSVAYAQAGPIQVSSAAVAAQADLAFNLGHKNVMGVSIPEITIQDTVRSPDKRGYGLTFTPPSIDSAAGEYEKALAKTVEFASLENALSILSQETLKARRRVNSLERRVIPELKNTEKYISMRLEELSRENFFRMKVMKKKKAGGGAA